MELFSNALITVPLLSLLHIWGELVEAYHGQANWGDKAEIYAYRLMPYSPSAHTHGNQAFKDEIAVRAANALCALVEEFCDKYSCNAEIDDQSIKRWCSAHNFGGPHRYDHRCYVRIIRKDKKD